MTSGMRPTATDPEDFPRMVVYRRAYGLAADLVEQAGMDWAGYGAADLPEREARHLAERIADEVRQEMEPDADREAVAEAIADAIAKRRPKW